MRKVTQIVVLLLLLSQLNAEKKPNDDGFPDFISLDDPNAISDLLKSTAAAGNPKAQLSLGKYYLKGDGVPKNVSEGVRWILKSAEQNDPEAQHLMGELYWAGIGFRQDYEKAFSWYLKSANQGHPEAEGDVGFCYVTGKGVGSDPATGVLWLKKSAIKGYVNGQFHLACCYSLGKGVEKNLEEEIDWFRRAADQGHTDASNILALKYYAKREYEFAKAYSRKTAHKGNAVGQFILGITLMAYPGGKDSTEATQLLLQSATQGYQEAQLLVGEAYLHNGFGGVKDSPEAVKWLKKAAEQGNAAAQFWLGGCHATGNGTIKDEIEAYALLNISAITYSKARIAIKALEQLLSADARIAGQQRAKQIQAAIEKKQAEKEGALDTLWQVLQAAEREKSLKGA